MSSRSLAAVVLLVGVLGVPIEPVFADDGYDAKVDVQKTDDKVEGVLVVGGRGEVLQQRPAAPAQAGAGRQWTCGYYLLENDIYEGYSPGLADWNLVRTSPSDGGHYVFICYDETGKRVVDRMTQYNAADPGAPLGEPGVPQIDIETAAVRIEALKPTIRTSPPESRPQVVGVETWYWMENSWTGLDAETPDVQGYTLRLRARPVKLVIDPGDGSDKFICTEATAKPWRAGGPEDTDCGHRYFKKSAGEPDQTFHVEAELVYDDVRWTATDPAGTTFAEQRFDGELRSGPFDLPLTVHEYQAVIR